MSDNIIFTSIPAVLASCATLEARIAMLDTILNGMETAMVTAATTGQFDTYRIDTGQTKSEVIYRNVTEMAKAYEGLFKTQQMLYTRLNINRTGRIIQLVDRRNFIGSYGSIFGGTS